MEILLGRIAVVEMEYFEASLKPIAVRSGGEGRAGETSAATSAAFRGAKKIQYDEMLTEIKQLADG